MSSGPTSPPTSPSALYAYKLRDDGYDVALLPPSPRSSTLLVAPKPTYPPTLNTDHSEDLYSSPSDSESIHDDPLSSPPPISLLPYAAPSRPSSATGFLFSHSEPNSDLQHPPSLSGITEPYLSPSTLSMSTPPPSSMSTPGPSNSASFSSKSSKSSNFPRRQSLLDPRASAGAKGRMISSPPPRMHMIRVPSEETRVLARAQQQTNFKSSHPNYPARGSVVLYRLDDPTQDVLNMRDVEALLPPNLPFGSGGGGRSRQDRSGSGSMTISRSSMDGVGSVAGSMRSFSSRHSVMSGDSRIPLIRSDFRDGSHRKGQEMQLVAYAYQPDALLDGEDDGEDDDWLHDPKVSFYASPQSKAGIGENKGKDSELSPSLRTGKTGYVEDSISMRGLGNYFTLWLLLVGLVALFIFYPVVTEAGRSDLSDSIVNNPNINSTGQATAR
ncbi:hypothetical protein C8J55DRAFT_491713 [Lentinula edodes]|uniref:Glycoside hydrolase family 16 protein n=1 Tax=Lentinula lateritia TaxID=40482 RepID=A0A9W9DHC6_9AGAR|nr:hypothetical protein C8J55DRAFT_491713 [Lentinula edodes]